MTDPTPETEGQPAEPASETPASEPASEESAAAPTPEEPAAEAAPAEEAAPGKDAEESDSGDDVIEGTEQVVASDYITDRSFSDFPLSPEVLQGITEKGYSIATGVQAAAIEPALAGRDLVVRSKTGTGKTAAFCIPMIERIEAGDRKTRAIVLAPTRELARQVAEECTAIAQFKDLRVTVIYGGVGFGPQEEALKAGSEIVVGTPGRLLDHIRRKNLDLSEAQFATLDEADEMLSMGFMQDVMKILDQTPQGRQVLMFSATVDDRVRSLITRYTSNALDIRLSTDTDKVEGITHVLYETSPNFHKVRALLALIDQEEPVSAIIFCNTREDTATVATFLARQGLDVELISGELPQNKREKVMDRVRSGQTQYLVATDVAARGIDISHLTHVLNYSLPDDPAVYLHRTGRVGRIGREGVAISLVGGQDIHTRNTLEKQYDIAFDVRDMPTPEEATAARVDRQAKAIRKAMGTMAFEGYLGTVRAIKKRPDGDMLLAAALRAFFLWDRMRKAEDGSGGDSVEALQKSREEKKQSRKSRDGGKGGGDRRRRRRRKRND